MRARRALVLGAVLGAIACVELGGPKDGVISISDLRLPYPSVVVGDLLRDSLGVPTPLRIAAFGANGDTLPGEPISYFSLDTTVSVDADGTVHGLKHDTAGARIVAGAGSLQTIPKRLIVTYEPTSVAKAAGATAVVFDTTTADTTKSSNWSPALALTLTSSTGLPVQGFVVKYQLVRSPTPLIPELSTAYIGNDAKTSNRDTTDVQGQAGRRVVVRWANFADADLRAGRRSDSIVVRASVTYKGVEINGSPIDFVVPLSKKP